MSDLSPGRIEGGLPHDEPMTAAVLPAPTDKIDGCPSCVLNTEAPRDWITTHDGYRCAYFCADCGHAWTTDWKAET